MTAKWYFEDGKLIAADSQGNELYSWLADEQLWAPLADMLNQNPQLSAAIMQPIVGSNVA